MTYYISGMRTCLPAIIFAALILFPQLSFGQQATPGLTDTKKNGGLQSTFSYKIVSTYGVSTSSQVTGNMRADTEAILKLKPGSIVSNKMGDANGNASAVFLVTPNGGNVDLKGITGDNIFLIDEGTEFKSHLYTVDNLDPSVSSTGSASATATHSTSVIVDKGETTFESSFSQTF